MFIPKFFIWGDIAWERGNIVNKILKNKLNKTNKKGKEKNR